MSQPQTWLNYLTDELGRCYVYDNGSVVLRPPTQQSWLPVGPDGWMDTTIKYARNSNYHELFRAYSTPFKYVKEGAFIVRDRKYRYGSQDKLYHVIQKLDKSFGGGWQHKFFYKGPLDMAHIEDNDNTVTCNIMEEGIAKALSANENTQYTIDIDVPEAVYIKHDGIELKQKASYLLNNGSLPNDLGGATIALQLINNEAVSAISAITQERVKTGNSAGALAGANTWFLETGSSDTTITINWDFNVYLELASGVGAVNPTSVFLQLIELESSSSTNNINIQQIPTTDPVLLYNHKHHMVGSTTVTVPANRKCMLYMTATQNRDFTFFTYDNDGSFTIDYNYRHRTTFVKGLRPMYVAQKLLDKMTGGGYTINSTYISSEWNNLLMTSGDAIRGIPGAKLTTSWKDFFDSYNSVANLSSGIRQGIMNIEKKGNAYQPTIQCDLGAVTGLKIIDSQDYLFNVIKTGYPNSDSEDVNGKDEFNVTFTWTTQVTTNNKTLDLVSKYRASMYEQELLRINLDGKTTTDNNNDNTVYFIHVEPNQTTGAVGEPAVYYKLLRNAYDSVTGLISPSSAYNMELHPELCLKRHGNYIRGGLYWMDATNIVRETTDKNDKVVVIKNGQTYIGNKNILVGSLDPALFIPLTFQVNGPMPDNLIDVMDAGPNGTFPFTYGGKQYLGFPLTTGIQPADNPVQETTLLCSPATNILNLITISR